MVAEARDNIIKTITLLAPYLEQLTPAERQEIAKMSDKTVAYVGKVVSYSDTNPEFCPKFLDVPELKVDYVGVEVLKPLYDLSGQLYTNIGDSMMLSGSEAYIASLSYYNNVKQAAKLNEPGAKVIYEDLRERFPGGRRKK